MRSFVLVHGGRHGSWCWQFVIDELERRGHEARAVDLALEDANAGAVEFARAVAGAAAGCRGPVTVVGHSMGGLVIPLVPASLEIDELAFVCSPLPVPGRALWEQVAHPPDDDLFIRTSLERVVANRDGVLDQDDAIDVYYHDLPDDLARWAADRLRPQLSKVTDEPSPLQEWPDVGLRYILGRNDRIVSAAWSRREVPRRLGVAPIELDTGHSPFLARPAELVDALLEGR